MMNMKLIAGMAAFGLFLSSGVVSAQNMNKSGKASTKTGNSKLGASLSTSANTKNSSSTKQTKGASATSIKLFGKKYKITNFKWMGRSKVLGSKKDKVNFVQIRLGNYRIYSEKGVKEIASRFSKKVTPLQLHRSIPVGAYWISLEARVGLQFDAEIALGIYTKKNNQLENVGLRARAGAAVYTDCTAASDFGVMRVGLRAKCKVFNGGVRAWVKINEIPNGVATVDGDATLYYVPVVFTLKAVVDKVKIKRKGWKIKRTWKEVYSIVLARWIPGKTNLSERSFLTY